MKKIILITFLLVNFLSAQNSSNVSLSIDYTYSIKIEGSPSATTVNSSLFVNDKESLYEMDFIGQSNFIDEEDGEKGTVLRIRPSKNPKIYKSRNEGFIFSIERVGMKPFLVKYSTSIFEWTIKDEFKTILGYKCQKASVNYRGRNYTAYFTLDLPFNTGPWKFDGLPGTILEVTEENNVLNLMANKVELLNTNIVIEKPYLNKTPITWDEYLTEYRKKNKELMSYSDENGVTMSLPKRKIEVLIED